MPVHRPVYHISVCLLCITSLFTWLVHGDEESRSVLHSDRYVPPGPRPPSHHSSGGSSSCSSGRWGSSCSLYCHCTVHCNKHSGYCSGSCTGNHEGSSCQDCIDYYKPGSSSSSSACVPCASDEWGTSCQNDCSSRCRGRRCTNGNGHCIGCNLGYTGSTCTQCATYYKRSSGTICTACRSDEWGASCQYTCPGCQGGCNNSNGHCRSGCASGYTGDRCTECGSCHKRSGNTCVPCEAGEWGTSCENTCPSGCQGGCQDRTGNCENCLVGFTGTRCEDCADGYTGHACRECAVGYRYTGPLCAACSDGSYGINCTSQCHCSVPCDKMTGDCNAICQSGYYGSNCQHACESGTWGAGGPGSNSRCSGRCNCANSGEVCRTTDGNCSSSGCANWYTGTGCDHQMPRLGAGEAPQALYVHGRNVMLHFAQWTKEYGGTGTVSYYMVEYGNAYSDEQVSVRYEHVLSEASQIISITLPDVRSNYTIRIVPYESSNAYSGPGEPSANVSVYTECADGWFGEGCDQQCNCSGDTCNKTDGSCIKINLREAKPTSSISDVVIGLVVGLVVLVICIVLLVIALVIVLRKISSYNTEEPAAEVPANEDEYVQVEKIKRGNDELPAAGKCKPPIMKKPKILKHETLKTTDVNSLDVKPEKSDIEKENEYTCKPAEAAYQQLKDEIYENVAYQANHYDSLQVSTTV